MQVNDRNCFVLLSNNWKSRHLVRHLQCFGEGRGRECETKRWHKTHIDDTYMLYITYIRDKLNLLLIKVINYILAVTYTHGEVSSRLKSLKLMIISVLCGIGTV